MNEINYLRDKLLNNPDKGERLKAVEELTKMASEGNEESAKIIYEMLKKEEDPEVWIKPFEVPPESVKDERKNFVKDESNYYGLSIMPILRKKNISNDQKTIIIKFTKSFIELFEAHDLLIVPGAITLLSYLTDEDDLFNFVDMWLKKETTNIKHILSPLKYHPEILQRIILALRDNPDEYKLKFIEIFEWFLINPLPDTAEIIGKELWLNLPSKYKEVVRLYYHKKIIDDIYRHLFHELENYSRYVLEHYSREFGEILAIPLPTIPTKHPYLEWLEGFERGAVTSSITSYSALQMVAEKIGLYLKDEVKQIETYEPSPITRRRLERELQREEDRELIPIDKYLGEYFPDDQLIKLYMTEIRDSAKRLNVGVEALRRVVEFHESAHAIVHLGRDADGKNFNTGAFKMVDGGIDPSPLHETLAQLLTYHCIKDIPELIKCFKKLNKFQPSAYRNWKNFTQVPLEIIRNILIGIRQGRIEASFDMFEMILI
jgi:hypothetical protein